MKTKTGVCRPCCGSLPLPKCCEGFEGTFPETAYGSLTHHKLWMWVLDPWVNTSPDPTPLDHPNWRRIDLPSDWICANCDYWPGPNPMLPLLDMEMILATPLPGQLPSLAYNNINFPGLCVINDGADYGCAIVFNKEVHGSGLYNTAMVSGQQEIFTTQYLNGWSSEGPYYNDHTASPGNSDVSKSGLILSCDPIHLQAKLTMKQSGSMFSLNNSCPFGSTYEYQSEYGKFQIYNMSINPGVHYTDTNNVTVNYAGIQFFYELLLEIIE